MSIEVIVIFKEICQDKFDVVICKLIFDFNETLVRMEDKLFQSIFKILKIYKVFEGKLHHISWIVNLFVFI